MNISTVNDFATLPEWVLPVLLVLLVWSFFWKAAGLWQAAKHKNMTWFIIFLLLNTVGILEMYYLFGIAKVKPNKLFK